MTATLRNPKTITLTTAQALTLFLAKQKVEQFDGSFASMFGGIFGIFGHGNVAGMGEALWQYRDQIPYFRGQNEQGIAHAAIAYAKASRCRRMMGVTTSIGPGATNLVTACALAHVNRLPVLFLPGDIYTSRRPDPVLQQLENEQSPLTSVNDCFIPVSQFFDRITHPEQLLQSLPQAMQILLHPVRRGPVTLALPQDTQAMKYNFPLEFFEEQHHYIRRPRPDRREVERATRLLKRAKRPLMIVGGGVHYSGAEETLRSFVDRHQIPFGETQAGKGAIEWNHPMNLGGIGVTGTPSANSRAREADLIFCVGTRLSDFTTASKSLFHHKEVKFVDLNIAVHDATKVKGEAVIADVKEGLEELSKGIEGYRADPFENEPEPIIENGALPSDAEVLNIVNQNIDPKAIVVCAAGGLPGELHKLWKTQISGGYHVEYGYSCMGYEIAGGLGVKMAHPDREVYVLVGDGSYLMLHTELLTANQLGYKINVVLLDNQGFGCINRLQKSCGSPPFGNLFSGETTVDFVANARSYGCHTTKVESLKELKCALEENQSSPHTCVTVIETNPEKGTPSTAWWDVAIAECSSTSEVQQAREKYEQQVGSL